MTLRPLYGHDDLLQRLCGAITGGRFPQVALLTGPRGAGKQRVALAVAQALLCDAAEAPCHACAACRLAAGLAHPDLHWFVPVGRLKAGEPDKQVAEVDQALGETMAERRADPLWLPVEGAVSHPLASIRLLQRRVALTPFRGRRKVVVLGDAERLVVQEASPEAANALLKLLEEPPADTTILLTAAEPQALLPTIRSRTVAVRVPRVSDEAVRSFFGTECEESGAALERRVVLAEGCIGRGLAQDPAAGDRDGQVDALLRAVAGGPERWAARALAQAPWDARGGYTMLLDALAVRARRRLEARAAQGDRDGAANLARIVLRIESARTDAQANRNPQIGLAVLAGELEQLT
jgi:DNA polymerase-3 subunit delta'